jgi:adenylyltransferase/sulfurtransferase
VVGAVEAAEAIKLIVSANHGTVGRLLVCDLWDSIWRTVDLSPLAAAGCPTCREADYPWLDGRLGGRPSPLCGRDAVQVPSAGGGVDLAALAERLATVGAVVANRWIVRANVEPGIQLSVFADGRAIVSGTRDEAKARGIVSRYLGA